MGAAKQRNGILCILIHGTFAPNAEWTQPGSDLRTAIESLPGITVITFPWDANNNQKSRYLAALELSKTLNEASTKYRHIFIVGHSHGGTIAMQAIHFSNATNTSIITLATPFIDVNSLDTSRIVSIMMCILIGIPYVLCTIPLREVVIEPYFNSFVFPAIYISYYFILPLIFVMTHEYWLFPLSDTIASRLRIRAKWYTGFRFKNPVDMLAISYKNDEVNRLFMERSSVIRRSTLDVSKLSANLTDLTEKLTIGKTVIGAMSVVAFLTVAWLVNQSVGFIELAAAILICTIIYYFLPIIRISIYITIIVFPLNITALIGRKCGLQNIFAPLWRMLSARAAFAHVLNSGPRVVLGILGCIAMFFGLVISTFMLVLIFVLSTLSPISGGVAGLNAFSLYGVETGLIASISGFYVLFRLGILPVDALVVSVRSVGRPRIDALAKCEICKKVFAKSQIPWWKLLLRLKVPLHSELYQDKEVIKFIRDRMSAGQVCA